MNELPIAHIAQYWGVLATWEYNTVFSDNWNPVGKVLDADVLDRVQKNPKWMRNFKLNLKSLALLSDDQVREMVVLAGYTPKRVKIERRGDWISAAYTIQKSKYMLSINTANGTVYASCFEVGVIPFNPEPIIAYAKRQGYYWPGSLDLAYVELTQQYDETTR